MRSRRPARIPVAWGPRMCLPPLNETRSAPIPTMARRLPAGRHRDRRVDDDRHVVAVSDPDQVVQGQAFHRLVGEVEHRAGALADGFAELVRERPLVGEPDLDDGRSGETQRMVVVVPVAPEHDDLVRHAGRIGEAVHLRRVEARDRRRGSHRQAGRGAGRDVARFGARHLGDDVARGVLEVLHPHEIRGCLGHRGHDSGGQHAAACLGAVAAGIDDAASSKLKRHRHLVPLPANRATGAG